VQTLNDLKVVREGNGIHNCKKLAVGRIASKVDNCRGDAMSNTKSASASIFDGDV
jgi:hypothetical protein